MRTQASNGEGTPAAKIAAVALICVAGVLAAAQGGLLSSSLRILIYAP